MSLRTRLLALTLGVAIASIVVVAFAMSSLATRAAEAEVQQDLEADAAIYDELITFAALNGSWNGVDSTVTALARAHDRRIALTTEAGRLIVDSDDVVGEGSLAMPRRASTVIDVQNPIVGYFGIEDTPAFFDEEVFAEAMEQCLASNGVDPTQLDALLGEEAEIDPSQEGAVFDCFEEIEDVSGPTAPLALLFLGSPESTNLTAALDGPSLAGIGVVIAAVLAGATLVAVAASRRVVRPLTEVTAAASRLASGDLAQRVGSAGSDEVGLLASAFNGMADSLERAERSRRQLTSDVAHELRNPLLNLSGTIEAAQDRIYVLDDDLLISMAEEVTHLEHLVTDLQQLSQAESGGLRIDLDDTDIGALATSVVESFRARANASQVTLTLTGSGAARVDGARLRQVLVNLVDNAIRHTPAGGAVDVSLAEQAGRLLIAVRDTGTGIPAEHLDHVFDRFFRVDAARTRGTGSGLGLAIARELVKLHGGEIRATSNAGAGSTFHIELPLALDTA